jgi:hypothetical protein
VAESISLGNRRFSRTRLSNSFYEVAVGHVRLQRPRWMQPLKRPLGLFSWQLDAVLGLAVTGHSYSTLTIPTKSTAPRRLAKTIGRPRWVTTEVNLLGIAFAHPKEILCDYPIGRESKFSLLLVGTREDRRFQKPLSIEPIMARRER